MKDIKEGAKQRRGKNKRRRRRKGKGEPQDTASRVVVELRVEAALVKHQTPWSALS
jgi:hypothetical protein